MQSVFLFGETVQNQKYFRQEEKDNTMRKELINRPSN
jgi:hypothetical protein